MLRGRAATVSGLSAVRGPLVPLVDARTPLIRSRIPVEATHQEPRSGVEGIQAASMDGRQRAQSKEKNVGERKRQEGETGASGRSCAGGVHPF